jgi:diaminopropionate ammonia-lyase
MSRLSEEHWYAHPGARDWRCAPVAAEVRRFHAGLPGYALTPLVELPELAAELAVGRVHVKDESARLGLGAFKVLGAAWAVHRVLARHPAGSTLRLIAATEGNHGRAVARLARIYGRPAEIYVPQGVRPAAVAALAAEGAQVTRVAGDYDEAVRRAARAAGKPDGGVLIQDTAWPGYEEVPAWIVEGYTTLFEEIDEQLTGRGPGLVVVPVGVGSLAQAAVTHYRSRDADPAPEPAALLAVEPDSARAALSSLAAGRLVTAPTADTAMAGLNCGTLSSLAWPVLRHGLDAAVAITDPAAERAVSDLAAAGITAGPTGAAALAGARTALTGPGAAERRAALGVGPDSTVVLLSTEGGRPRW